MCREDKIILIPKSRDYSNILHTKRLGVLSNNQLGIVFAFPNPCLLIDKVFLQFKRRSLPTAERYFSLVASLLDISNCCDPIVWQGSKKRNPKRGNPLILFLFLPGVLFKLAQLHYHFESPTPSHGFRKVRC